MQLELNVSKLLLAQQKTISVAESCTGGLLAHSLTNIPGASAFFMLGVVAYDNAAKIKLLNIRTAHIKTYGAVSAEVVRSMAQGVRKILKTDFGIGITGIAGPTGGNAHKPVGLTYIAVCDHTQTIVQQFHFKGTRFQIKTLAKNAALQMLLKLLKRKITNKKVEPLHKY